MLFTVLTNSPTMPCLRHFENALSVQVDEGYELSVCTLHIRVFHSLTHRKFPISFQWFCFFSTILSQPFHCAVIHWVRPVVSMQLALKASLPVDMWQWLKAIFLPEETLRDTVECWGKCLWILSEKKEERWHLWFSLYAAFCNQVAEAGVRTLWKEAHQNSTLAFQASLFSAASQSSRGVSLFSF